MNRKFFSVTCRAAACALVLLAGSAHAIPIVNLRPYQVGQVNSSAMARVGLIVDGEGVGLYFTLGGGYTLRCADSPLPIPEEYAQPFFAVLGQHNHTIAVPPTTPTQYEIAGFGSWPQSSCHLCNFEYRGRAIESAASIAVSGAGVSFTFSPSGGLETTKTGLQQFNMCKLPPSTRIKRGCYP